MEERGQRKCEEKIEGMSKKKKTAMRCEYETRYDARLCILRTHIYQCYVHPSGAGAELPSSNTRIIPDPDLSVSSAQQQCNMAKNIYTGILYSRV